VQTLLSFSSVTVDRLFQSSIRCLHVWENKKLSVVGQKGQSAKGGGRHDVVLFGMSCVRLVDDDKDERKEEHARVSAFFFFLFFVLQTTSMREKTKQTETCAQQPQNDKEGIEIGGVIDRALSSP
jgi:hypothetical protein